MSIRMSGLVSNLDTDSIIKELMTAQSAKKTKISNKITTGEWKQEKWKELNTKIYALYTGTLTKMKTQGNYNAKKVSSSNESKVSVKASNDAVEGSHSVKVSQLASSQYVTSGKVTAQEEGSKVTTATKLTDLGMAEGNTITIETKSKSYDFDISEHSTVNDFLAACKSAGLTATFDANQSRFFISSSSSGAENAFSMTTSVKSSTDEKNALRDTLGYSSNSTSVRTEIDAAILTYVTSDDEDKQDAAYSTLLTSIYNKTTSEYVSNLKTGYEAGTLDTAAQTAIDNAVTEALDRLSDTATAEQIATATTKAIASAATTYAKEMQTAFTNADSSITWTPGENPYADAVSDLNAKLAAYETAVDTETRGSIAAGTGLEKLGLVEITYDNITDGRMAYGAGIADALRAVGGALVGAADSIIEYNGATMVNSSNTVIANGLTFTLQDVTSGDETINLTVSKDTQAVYDMVKSFLKEYNSILKELTDIYDAPSARGYDPLTSEEREAMSEEEIEKWETKIKDSLLRRDSTVGGLISTMKDSLAGSIEYNGKKYSLSSFGITSKIYTEKGKLHIAGDSDDTLTADDKDKLMAALQDDPEAVMTVLSGLTQNLYSNMNEKMKSSTLSSALTFYNDKVLTKELKTYKSDLKKMEEKLKDLEDKYYKQFSAMETAMSKLSSQSNSLASLLGTSTTQ